MPLADSETRTESMAMALQCLGYDVACYALGEISERLLRQGVFCADERMALGECIWPMRNDWSSTCRGRRVIAAGKLF